MDPMTSKTYVMLLGDSTGLDQSCERTFFESTNASFCEKTHDVFWTEKVLQGK